jgi:hypothetical protein
MHTGAGPGDGISLVIGNRHNGVVERSLDMDFSLLNILLFFFLFLCLSHVLIAFAS